MVDRHDILRHMKVVQHASVRWEKSQVSEAPVPSDHAETSISGAHVSRHAFPSSFSRRRHVSPTGASLPPSSRRRQVSPIQALEVPESQVVPPTSDAAESVPPPDSASKSVPPPTSNVVELVPPPDGEAAKDAESEPFGGGHIDLSLLSMYPDHIARHIWDIEVALVGLNLLIYVLLIIYYKFMILFFIFCRTVIR